MWVTRTGVRAGRVRVNVSGLGEYSGGWKLHLHGNHVSNLDPPALVPMIPEAKCVVLLKKRELMSIPLLGRAMLLGDVHSGGAWVAAGGGADQRDRGGDARGAGRSADRGVSGGHAVARREVVALQEGAVLSGAGDTGLRSFRWRCGGRSACLPKGKLR